MENSFKKLAQYTYSSEAIVVKGKLESEGIEVFLRDHFTIDTDPMVSNAIGGVKLFVKETDYENATKILSEISDFSLDDSGKPIECPHCGAQKAQLFTSITDFKSLISFLVSMFFVILPFYTKYKYHCENCNKEFSL
ncbi:DUF2007 domain-containing protein [Flavobacterium sp. NST-5]|uniref:DUF2007 domain-containing protein n=1 Tax=Flavobacterium ichthyis TaxID=2698827 RepID=A0ABW9Z9U3_9FLAO|nr:DUF2007 domain-containing protein [Flavobacterium ichthyis]NBL65663.1 DUF2007 domain-containing protein [Flavobacterium ichthyis]